MKMSIRFASLQQVILQENLLVAIQSYSGRSLINFSPVILYYIRDRFDASSEYRSLATIVSTVDYVADLVLLL